MFQLSEKPEYYSKQESDLTLFLNVKTTDYAIQLENTSLFFEEDTSYSEDTEDPENKSKQKYYIKLKTPASELTFTKNSIEEFFKLLRYPSGNLKILNKENILSDVTYLIHRNLTKQITLRYNTNTKEIYNVYPNDENKPVNPLNNENILKVIDYVKSINKDNEILYFNSNDNVYNVTFINRDYFVEYIDRNYKLGYNLHFDSSLSKNHIQISSVLYDKKCSSICFLKNTLSSLFFKQDLPTSMMVEPLFNHFENANDQIEQEQKDIEKSLDKLYELSISSQKMSYLYKKLKINSKYKMNIFKEYLIKHNNNLIEEIKSVEDLNSSKLSIYKLFLNCSNYVSSLLEEHNESSFKIKDPITLSYFTGSLLENDDLIYQLK